MICTAHQIYLGENIEKNKMGEACKTNGGSGEVNTGFWRGLLREKDQRRW
jgi:hypothetical protein